MKKIIYIIVSILVIMGAFFLFSWEPKEVEPSYHVAYIGAQVTSPFWKSLGHTIIDSGKSRNIEVEDYTLLEETEEIRNVMFDRILKKNYDAVIMGLPSNRTSSIKFMKDLINYNVPVFVVDTKVDEDLYSGFVAIDNYGSGKLVGNYISSQIDSGEVLIILSNDIHENAVQRMQGAKEILEEAGIAVNVVNVNSLTWNSEDVKNITELKENNYAAIFSVWDEGIVAARDVVKIENPDSKTIYVGFDGLDFVLDEINDDKLSATIMQDVNGMADKTFYQIENYFNNSEFEKNIIVPGVLVTKNNVQEYLK